MNLARYLPALAAALCVPGIALRTAHFMSGFELSSGLPVAGEPLYGILIAFFVLCAVVFAVLTLPLRARRETPFETSFRSANPLFRTALVVSGLVLIIGGAAYLMLTVTTPEQDAVAWARILEGLYAVLAVIAGGSLIGLCKAQGAQQMTERGAVLTVLPLLWSCAHLLVTYRMTCTDPKMPSFAFGLIADIALVLACYFFARILYAKPTPSLMAAFSAFTFTLAVSDLGGYGVAYALGMRAVYWPQKMVLRSVLSVAAALWLFAELCLLVRKQTAQTPDGQQQTPNMEEQA